MHVVLIAAQSLDGRITRHDIPGSDFTSQGDKKHFRNALQSFDCRVMGSRSYEVTREGTLRSAARGRFHLVLTSRPHEYSADAVEGGLIFANLDPHGALRMLKDKGFGTCALIGGAKLHASFLRAQLVNELWITVEPVVFGAGTPLIDGTVDVSLSLVEVSNLSSDTLLLKYRINPAQN